jgi:hypothetical protein
VGAPASASPRPPPAALLVLTLPWCAPGALGADGALGPPLRAALAQAAGGAPMASVVLAAAFCGVGGGGRRAAQWRRRALGGSEAITAGVPMVVTATLSRVADFVTEAEGVLATGAPPVTRPGAYYVGGPPDPTLSGNSAAAAASALAAQLIALAIGGAMGCGSADAGGAPGGGESAGPLEPFGPFFAAFVSSTGLPPSAALSCAPGSLRVSMVTPPAAPTSGDAAAARDGITAAAVLVPAVAAAALAAAAAWRARRRRGGARALTAAPAGAAAEKGLTNPLQERRGFGFDELLGALSPFSRAPAPVRAAEANTPPAAPEEPPSRKPSVPLSGSPSRKPTPMSSPARSRVGSLEDGDSASMSHAHSPLFLPIDAVRPNPLLAASARRAAAAAPPPTPEHDATAPPRTVPSLPGVHAAAPHSRRLGAALGKGERKKPKMLPLAP